MNETIEEPMKKKTLLRKRFGKVLFWIGIIFVLASFVISPLIVVGIVLVIIGIIMVIHSRDAAGNGIWVLMMSPFAGSN